jgi:hypothetical protein
MVECEPKDEINEPVSERSLKSTVLASS